MTFDELKCGDKFIWDSDIKLAEELSIAIKVTYDGANFGYVYTDTQYKNSLGIIFYPGVGEGEYPVHLISP